MLKLLLPLPKTLTVALSGGVDSVAITDFLTRKHEVTCAFFHHGTENSERAHEFVKQFCEARNLPLIVGYNNEEKPNKISAEEHWRDMRYKFLNQFQTVVTGHNLDDCVETYIFSALHGTPKLIPTVRNNVLRPFLTTPKSEFIEWCIRHKAKWIDDTSNADTKYMRNYIRHELMPHALVVNPGLPKLVKKLVLDKLKIANS